MPGRHQRPQHRHHSALTPDLAVFAELFHQRVPRLLILVQVFNIQRGQAKHRGRQRAAQGIFPLRGQHRLQQPEQLLGLQRLKNAVAVREVDRGDAQRLQRFTHLRRLQPVAHQHGNIRSLYRARGFPAPQQRAPLLTGAQPVADLRGAELRHKGLIIARPDSVAGHQPDVHRRYVRRVNGKAQPLILCRRLHRQKRDLAEHEGVIAEAEQPIDAAHHARRGAPVGIEGVVRGNVAARFHIGKDIGAAKGVDGLLRIADQQQSRLRLPAPDAAKNPVLLRVGVLKFIDHRHRKTLANGAGQRLAAVAAQRLVKPAEHIVKPQLAAAALFAGDRIADLDHRSRQHQIGERQRGGQQRLHGAKQGMHRWFATGFGALEQKRLGKFLQRVGQLVA